MKPARRLVSHGLEYCGALTAVLVVLPLLALGAFLLRGVLVLAAAAALAAGALLWCVHPGFRAWFQALGGREGSTGSQHPSSGTGPR